MRTTKSDHTSLVSAAQAGDERALGELAAANLPLVYSIVRRALAGHPGGVDDVVQDTMLRALRRLPSLREPEHFRVWLASIAVRQASTHLQRQHLTADRRAPLEVLSDAPDAEDFEDLTMLRVELSGQRRQVGRAVGWLDDEDRVLWSLWWLEIGEELTRAELAAALGVSVAHAAVRVQRMRNRLEQARALVAALDARPRCPWLDTVVAEWSGIPSPLWRKRISRHTRTCVACARAADGAIDTERLLAGFALLPVPAALTAALDAHDVAATAGSASSVGGASSAGSVSSVGSAATNGAVKAGWLTGLPIAKIAVASLAAGVAATALAWPDDDRPPQAPSAPPAAAAPSAGSSSAAASALRSGPVSLELAAAPGRYLGTDGQLGLLIADDAPLSRQRATFEAVPGLADATCYSLRSADGQYLRHASWRLRLSRDEGTRLFRGDATFCPIGAGDGQVLLESSNYRGYFIHPENGQLWVQKWDGTTTFRTDSAFFVRAPLS
ncbi:sigma-70 family RNA polymerase sigma factor [Dactylosporangium sp. CA-139066]|uniref:sigma-70 family RNA polymerase sigma factor n=1 Tax=Dactylosporangium sp. CA-139066 TaxID=3239930 RepID=UPI003D924E9E